MAFADEQVVPCEVAVLIAELAVEVPAGAVGPLEPAGSAVFPSRVGLPLEQRHWGADHDSER
jgi:hypothetical protein